LYFCHKSGEQIGYYVISSNKGRACRLYSSVAKIKFRDTIAETIKSIEISGDEREAIVYPKSDIALAYGIEYA
jgi:hypothetical protein